VGKVAGTKKGSPTRTEEAAFHKNATFVVSAPCRKAQNGTNSHETAGFGLRRERVWERIGHARSVCEGANPNTTSIVEKSAAGCQSNSLAETRSGVGICGDEAIYPASLREDRRKTERVNTARLVKNFTRSGLTSIAVPTQYR
jgi:hypothetical protein